MSESKLVNPYDESPYPHLTHKQTHPERMETLATMLGLKPAPVDGCRVLELGCASGFNLFPLAYMYPDSRFVGIDYSQVEIDYGLERLEELGYTNVELLCMDVMDMGEEMGEFDYIIAHGLYSWVPVPVRDRLMAVCKQNLAPHGVAYISYNVYPGWSIVGMFRAMMLYRIREIESPAEQALEARKLMEFLSEVNDPNESAYGAMLRSYLDNTAERKIGTKIDDGRLLLHDELSPVNDPLYFHQFIDHAESHGLQYLVESEFSNAVPAKFPAEAVKKLRSMSQDSIDMEQYMDFMNFRIFRTTLLCHKEVKVNRTFTPHTIRNLYLSSQSDEVTDKPEGIAEDMVQFAGLDQARFTTDHPLTVAALKYLRSIFPRGISFMDLIKTCVKEVTLPKEHSVDEHAALVAANLIRAYSYSESLVEFHVHPAQIVTEISEKPEASAIARWQIDYMYRVTSMRHERVELDNFGRCVLRQLDGTHGREDLLAQLRIDRKEQRFKLKNLESAAAGSRKETKILDEELTKRLEFFAHAALLIS